MKNLVGLKELRENVNSCIAHIRKGTSFIVVRRSRPTFKIAPSDDDDGLWETVVGFTKFYKDGIPARQLLKNLWVLHEKSSQGT